MPKRIYLDVCALCRPFDDQDQLRVRMETEAVRLIEDYVRRGQYIMIVSPAHYTEIATPPHQDGDEQLTALLNNYGQQFDGDIALAQERAGYLFTQSFNLMDSAHVAFAENSAAEFITCDDRLIRKCRKTNLGTPAFYPEDFCRIEGLK
ncbi:MAG: hypothetical protein NTX50_19745 [Candidatus Sumerlaeota bacterium]|nr:hypothetical protein [Candidatus Sumerlaeota bacterium]